MRITPGIFSVWMVLALIVHGHVLGAETIKVRLVGGRLVTPVILKGPAGDVATNLLVDVGMSDALVLHKNAISAAGLRKVKSLDLELGAVRLKDVAYFPQDDFRDVEELTAEFASELGDLPIVGALGLAAFGNDVLQLDVASGSLRFGKAEELVIPDPRQVSEVTFQPTPSGLNFTAVDSNGQNLVVQFNTRQFEGLAEMDAFQRLKIGQATTTGVNLSGLTILPADAFRRSSLKGISRPLPDLVVGTSFASRYLVTIDITAHRMTLQAKQDAPPAVSPEQSYFFAEQAGDAPGIERFVQSNGQSWLVREAANRLIDLRLADKSADDEACTRAVELLATTISIDRRAQQLLRLVDTKLASPSPQQATMTRAALNVAAQYANKDKNAAAIHQINGRRGVAAMRQGDLKEARRLLLSAAFGLPGDARINLWLGDFYRKNNQPTRAWSRYVESAISKESPMEAFTGLDELSRDKAFRSQFSVKDAELILEGRMPALVPPRIISEGENCKVKVVELFTDATAQNSVGPQLAFEAFRQFVAGRDVVFLAYSSGGPLATQIGPARLNYYGAKSPALVLDGATPKTVTGDAASAGKLFEDIVSNVIGSAGSFKSAFSSQLTFRGPVLEGEVRLKSTDPLEGDWHVHAVLCERCVFVLGGNGLGLHYAVARGPIGPIDGWPVENQKLEQSWTVSTRLSEILKVPQESKATSRPTTPPSPMRAPLPDLRECSVVLLLQNSKTHEIAGASVVVPQIERGSK